jgi:DNA-binding CsgD family transcriptional regulator/DNA-binding transcriptional ArsR family regulator
MLRPSKERLKPFRALPTRLRLELLAKLEQSEQGLSPNRLRRIVHILERHVFVGETPQELCGALGISRQQFYNDLREGIRRFEAMLERKGGVTTTAVVEEPRRSMIAQAQACYQAGMSLRASEMLDRLHSQTLTPAEAVEVAALELDVAEDLLKPFPAFHSTVTLIEETQRRAEREGASEAHRLLLRGTTHWLQTRLSCYGTDRSHFLREYDATVASLRAPAFAGDHEAAVAFCRYMLTALLMLDDLGAGFLDERRADRALADVGELLSMRGDMPAAMRAILHARFAAFYNGRITTAHRSREQRVLAYRAGIDCSSTVSVWYALALEVSESVARGETEHGLACASALYESICASDSAEWQPVAHSRMALAYTALGRFDEAERFVTVHASGEQPIAHEILPACDILLGRRQYRECSDLATILIDSAKGIHRACALTHRAKAAYHIGDIKRATTDIKASVEMLDTLHGQSFYVLCSAYRTAHLITQENRYRDTLYAIETLLEDDTDAAALVGNRRGLTSRQRQIARLAAAGETNRAIASALNLSPRTVGNALTAVYTRLGVRARWQLADALERNASSA